MDQEHAARRAALRAKLDRMVALGISGGSDAFTQASSLASDTAAYEKLAYFALRPQLYFDAVADVKPTNQTHRGASVTFFIYNDLAAQTSTLSETADPDAIAASDATVVVTPLEKGAVIKTTAKLRASSLLEISEDVANLIGYNAGLSLDVLAEVILRAGDNVRYSKSGANNWETARNRLTPVDVLSAEDVRRTRADLVGANVMPKLGNYFGAYIHSDPAYDLRGETGAAAWRDPHTYSAPENIWTGEIGLFEGFRFMETPRAPLFADAGSSTTLTDVYATLFCGKQALALGHYNAEGYQRYPAIVRGPMVDALQRIQPIGWKWAGAYSRFREAALRRVESASAIGANT